MKKAKLMIAMIAIFSSFGFANPYCCELEQMLTESIMAGDLTTVIQVQAALDNEC